MRSHLALGAAQKGKKNQIIGDPQTSLLQTLLSHTLEWEEYLAR